MPTYDEIHTQLTAPGAPFEIVTETVRGLPMKVFKNRERSMREKIANTCQRGDVPCMVQGQRSLSYREFGAMVWGAARALDRDHGLRPGDRLAVLAYNSPDWLISLFGATSLGGIGVGLNGWWSVEEIDYGLRDSGSRFLVVDHLLYPRVEKLLPEVETLEKVIFIGPNPPPGTIPIASLLEPCDEPPTQPIAEDDPFVILYTSGTTGRPKGCITTHRGTISQVTGIVFSGIAGALLGGASPLPTDGSQAASLITSPLFHVGGLHSGLCTALTAGAKLVFSEGKFDPEQTMALIEREKITVWGAIPTMFHRVVNSPRVRDYDLSSLRSVSMGGAPTAPETLEKAQEVLPVTPSLANAYGLTETHGVATLNGGKDLLGRMTSIGRPIPVLDMRIVKEDGSEAGTGELGELQIYGPTITPGYWNRPEATAEAVVDGWLLSGDIAYRDEEGFYFVVDRAKDMLLRGGENVYCVEIENCLAEHPQIDEAAIVGVPDPDLGERVKAVVRTVPGAQLDVEQVQRHVASHMASFKVPEFVEFTDRPLPRNPAGKLLKNLLRGSGEIAFDADELEDAKA